MKTSYNFGEALKKAGLYKKLVNRNACAVLALLAQKPHTLDQIRIAIPGPAALSPLLYHKLAEYIPGPSPVFYKITKEGEEYLEKLKTAELTS